MSKVSLEAAEDVHKVKAKVAAKFTSLLRKRKENDIAAGGTKLKIEDIFAGALANVKKNSL